MRIDEVRPPHCHARARRLLAEVVQIRATMGRDEDARPVPELSGAQPRDCYFTAIATWNAVDRLASEVGAPMARFAHAAPDVPAIRPGDVLAVIDAALARVELIAQRLGIKERAHEVAVEQNREPTDVLATLARVNRELGRALDQPFTPGDVYRVVALASAYATRLGGRAELAPFEAGRRPRDCYQHLLACHLRAAELLAARSHKAISLREPPADTRPSDVYDLAQLVLGEVACLHALAGAPAVHAFEPVVTGHRMPADVDQLARTLDAQLVGVRS